MTFGLTELVMTETVAGVAVVELRWMLGSLAVDTHDKLVGVKLSDPRMTCGLTDSITIVTGSGVLLVELR